MNPSRHINPEHLHPYLGTDTAMIRSFLDLFRQELVRFKGILAPVADHQKLGEVRAAYHSIVPSLKMLRLESLMELIDRYKSDQAASAGDTGVYSRITALIREIQSELAAA